MHAESTIENITYYRKKKCGQREVRLKVLPTEVRQELKNIPAEAKVMEHVRSVAFIGLIWSASGQAP